MDKSLPEIDCDTSSYEKTSADQILRGSSLNDLTERIQEIAGNYTVRHSIPEGRSNLILSYTFNCKCVYYNKICCDNRCSSLDIQFKRYGQ